MNFIANNKTHFTVLLGIIAAIVHFLNGGVDIGQFALEVLGLLGISTLRLGVDKNPAFDVLSGIKTHLIVILAVITIGINFALGTTDATTAMQQLLVALGASGLRMGIAKNK